MTENKMSQLSDDELLETLELYIAMTEKQDEVIHHLGEIIRKQATDLAHLRNILRIEQGPGE